MKLVTIAVDAMGGDFGPLVTVPAAICVLKKYPNLRLILVGDEAAIRAELARHSKESGRERLDIIHTTEAVTMDESPAIALRSKKDSSMRVAINQIKAGKAEACVSAGNTGALMAIARFVLRTLPGVDRPAIISSLPTIHHNKEVRMLDLGANVDSSAENLYQFAVMGSVLVSALDNLKHPKVALLNIGEEEIKGTEQIKHAASLLTESQVINYIGYLEGNDIFSGIADVIVCDGFIGNIALKAIEGSAKLFVNNVKSAFNRNWLTKLTGLLARPSLGYVRKAMDPGRRNGASLIGLQGIVIKSHGGANARAFANAIEEAIRSVEKNIPALIRQEVETRLEESEQS